MGNLVSLVAEIETGLSGIVSIGLLNCLMEDTSGTIMGGGGVILSGDVERRGENDGASLCGLVTAGKMTSLGSCTSGDGLRGKAWRPRGRKNPLFSCWS